MLRRSAGHVVRLLVYAPLALPLLGWIGTLASGGADFPFRWR